MPKHFEYVSMPEPTAVVHVDMVFQNDQPIAYSHDRFHITLRLNGDGYYRTMNSEHPMRVPIVSFSPPHADDVNGLIGPCEAWYVGFQWPGVRWELAGDDMCLLWDDKTLRRPFVKVIDHVVAADLVSRFRALEQAFAQSHMAAMLRTRSILAELIAQYFDLATCEPQHRNLVRFTELLVENAFANTAIEQLATDAGFSADHMRMLFRQAHGVSPLRFRTNLRMARARELLITTTMNIAEVAVTVGYDDPKYFSRAFKKQHGVCASEMLRRFSRASDPR